MVLSPAAGRPVALWAIPVADIGGVARHALDTARAGVPGWDLVFVVPDGPLVAQLRAAGASVEVAAFGPAHGLRSSASALRRTIAAHRPRVLHTHLSYADVVGALVKPRSGTALVTTEHGIADDDLVYHSSRTRSRLRAQAHRARFRRTDALIAVSEATLRVARAKWHVPDRVSQSVVLNGVDHVATRPVATGLDILSLARLAPEKQLPELVAGFALLAQDHPEAHLTLAGVGPLEGELRDLVERRGLTDRVDLPGFLDAEEALSRAHVLAQLSVWENCSYSLLDAAAGGHGVVASPVGGNPEILPSRCLVDPGDARAVAEALLDQGLDVARRPGLPLGWPDVSTMTKLIGEVYAEVTT